MQVPGTSKAPKTFDDAGEDFELEDLLDQFKSNAAKLDDKDKLTLIGKYAALDRLNLVEVLDGFKTADWEQELYYPNAFPASPYTRQSLEAFTAKAALTEIVDHNELNKYYQNFLPIARWLVTHKKLTIDDLNKQFWLGFHPFTRISLKRQLQISKPDHDISTPYDYKDVLKAARCLFYDKAFDLDTPFRSGTEKTSWVDRMEVKERDGSSEKENGRTTARSGTKEAKESVDPLIKNLSSLQVHDTNYAATLVLYYPTVADRFPLPSSFRPAVPTHPPSTLPAPYFPRPTYALRSGQHRTCAFCKRPGCFTGTCDIAAQYMRDGKIIQTNVWYGGADISRWPTIEPFLFRADHTVQKYSGHSPFDTTHDTLDLNEATLLLPKLDKPFSGEELLATRARQFDSEERDADLAATHDRVKARYPSISQFERDHAHTIREFDFPPDPLVLVCDTQLDTDLSIGTKPHYFGPMLVIRRTQKELTFSQNSTAPSPNSPTLHFVSSRTTRAHST